MITVHGNTNRKKKEQNTQEKVEGNSTHTESKSFDQLTKRRYQ